MTFSDSAIARLARLASAAVEGSGSGHTEYRKDRAMGRYIVGGVVPARIFPIGTARPVIRAAVRRMLGNPAGHSRMADTLGYWEDAGSIYVDLGDTWGDLGIALDIARSRRELAIFDRLTGECITVP